MEELIAVVLGRLLCSLIGGGQLCPRAPTVKAKKLCFEQGFVFQELEIEAPERNRAIQDSTEAGGGDAMSMNWGTIRIILGTLGGGALGFYVMHNVENNYKVGSFYVFFQRFTCHKGFR